MSRWPNSTELLELVLEQGLDAVGVAPASASTRGEAVRQWMARGYYADMLWFAYSVNDRLDPTRRDPEVRSWLVVAASYYTADPPAELWNDPQRGRVARYAWGPDYHKVIRQRLGRVAERIRQLAGLTERPRVAVDTAPILERELAERAGLGFIGRNTVLIAPSTGSWVHLGAIGLPWSPEPTLPVSQVPDGCSNCHRCRVACPTGALVEDRVLDARRCIAWMTIECRAAIPLAYRHSTHRWLVGCDLCQECCPWNLPTRVRASRCPWLKFDPDLHTPRLADAITISPEDFSTRYAGTTVLRITWARWVRNAIVAASARSADPDIAAAVARHVDSANHLIREHARWFLSLRSSGDPTV